MPLMKAIGVKTTMFVRVDAMTATPTSPVPRTAASWGSMPSCTSRLIFSITTIELVTSVPIEMPSAMSVMILSEKPLPSMRRKVATTEAGIDMAATIVCRQSCRKTRSSIDVSMMPIRMFLSTSEIDSSVKIAELLVISTSMSGSMICSSSSRAL